jgi:hypothetical protein
VGRVILAEGNEAMELQVLTDEPVAIELLGE